ncbi:diaminopimelate epimerase [Fervidobacterium thailandense]|uniref:Diaminopimelate epimerase n=1 Tax=Fervidobacterium thailandense TaxID=1008305 RepID=A0A1E3G2B0_9BACT|nr:diaminopimelate epimerase [Fervidobacterium thailandense]ODN30424.1 hypothetical protein A4H02_05155 [Fervidobacterium thailandense]
MDGILRISPYTATGNTFVVVELLRESALTDEEKSQIVIDVVGERDGVIFVERSGEGLSFRMDYFNRDGRRAAFCGNGARVFARYLRDKYGLFGDLRFETSVGFLHAIVGEEVKVEMPRPRIDREIMEVLDDVPLVGKLVIVGVPHLTFKVTHKVTYERVWTEEDLFEHLMKYAPELRRKYDANVNFYRVLATGHIKVRTYERGVERETFSCGSGVTACAYVYAMENVSSLNHSETRNGYVVHVTTRGGLLKVHFETDGLYLSGGVVNE